MGIRVRELVHQIGRRPMREAHLQSVIGRIAAGVQHVQGAKSRRWPRIRHACAIDEVHLALCVDGGHWRVEIVESEQMNAPRPLISHRQQCIAGELPLDAQRVFQAVWRGVNSVERPVRVA